MKTLNQILFPLLFTTLAFAQSSSYSLGYNPMTTLTALKAANTIHDISPLLWRFMGLPAKDRFELDHLRKQDSAQGYYIQPPANNYPNIVSIVFVDISIVSKGQSSSVRGSSETLTSAQKNILATADMSSNIELTIWFTYKTYEEDRYIKKGQIAVTVVPEVEACYTGGGSLADYFIQYVDEQYPSNHKPDAVQNASIQFTVAEDGSLEDIKLRRLSGDYQTDRLLLEAVKRMPKWKPAQNAKGIPIKQKILFAWGGC